MSKQKNHAVKKLKKQRDLIAANTNLPKATPQRMGKVGHPSLYRKELCKALVEAGEKGLTEIQFCAKIGVSKETFFNWRDTHPDFKEAVNLYKAKIEAWYVSLVKNKMLGMKQIVNGMPLNLDLGALVWFGKNICKWTDRQEQTISVGTSIVEVSREENELV